MTLCRYLHQPSIHIAVFSSAHSTIVLGFFKAFFSQISSLHWRVTVLKVGVRGDDMRKWLQDLMGPLNGH